MVVTGIRIFSKEGSQMDFDPADLFLSLEKWGSLRWCLLFIDGVIKPGQDIAWNEIVEKVNRSPNGCQITWLECQNLISQFFQVYELQMIGARTIDALHRYATDRDMHNACEITLELIDGSVWEIYTNNIEIISFLKSEYHNNELIL